MSGQAGSHARLATLLDGRAQALGFQDGGALVLRVRRGWCLACAVVRFSQDGPRPDCGCAQEVQLRSERASVPYGRVARDRLKLGWCLHHAVTLPPDGSLRPADCPECRAALPDLARVEAEASASGFWLRYPVERSRATAPASRRAGKASPAFDVLRDIGPEVSRGYAPVDLMAQSEGLHPLAGAAAWAEVQALLHAQEGLTPRQWRRARDLQRRSDALAQALPGLIADAMGDSLTDAGKARLVRLMLARQALLDRPDWPQLWPVYQWLRFVPPELWPKVRKGWLSLRGDAQKNGRGVSHRFAVAVCAAYQGATDPWAFQAFEDLGGKMPLLTAYRDLVRYEGD